MIEKKNQPAKQPCPVLLMLNTAGSLVPFHVVNEKGNSAVNAAEQISPAGMRRMLAPLAQLQPQAQQQPQQLQQQPQQQPQPTASSQQPFALPTTSSTSSSFAGFGAQPQTGTAKAPQVPSIGLTPSTRE